MLRRNENALDRSLRAVVGVGLLIGAIAAFGLASGGPLGIVSGAVGAILVATAITGFCPLYRLLGLTTCHSC